MKPGDLVKLKRPEQFPGYCDAAGLLVSIETPRVPDAARDAGASLIMTVLWPINKTPSASGNPMNRHYDNDLEVINADR